MDLQKETRQRAELTKQIQANTAAITREEQAIGRYNRQVGKYNEALRGVGNNLTSLAAGYLSFTTALNVGREIVEITAKYEQYNAILTNSLGSQEAAAKAMDEIKKKAASTPFSVDELTKSFIRFRSRGLTLTMEQMTQIGDLAASLGESFERVAEALLDLPMGQTKRIEELGIAARSIGGKELELTFRGQTTVIKQTNEAMLEYLSTIANVNGVKGTMAEISGTLKGQLSNLGDTWENLLATIGAGNSGVLKDAVSVLSEMLTAITDIAAGTMTWEEILKGAANRMVELYKTLWKWMSWPIDALNRQLTGTGGAMGGALSIVRGKVDEDKAFEEFIRVTKEREEAEKNAAKNTTEIKKEAQNKELENLKNTLERGYEIEKMYLELIGDEYEKKYFDLNEKRRKDLEKYKDDAEARFVIEQQFIKDVTALQASVMPLAPTGAARFGGSGGGKPTITAPTITGNAPTQSGGGLGTAISGGASWLQTQADLYQPVFGGLLDQYASFYEQLDAMQDEQLQREIDIINQQIDNKQRLLDEEKSKKEQGLANDYDIYAREVEALKQREAAKRAEMEKSSKAAKVAAQIQVGVDSILQISNITTAGTDLVRDGAKKGIVGFGISLGLLAILLTAIARFKANAKKLKDGEIDIDGPGNETSDSIPAKLSKGESVINARSTKRVKGTLQKINDGASYAEIKRALDADFGIKRELNYNSGFYFDSGEMKKTTNAIEKGNEQRAKMLQNAANRTETHMQGNTLITMFYQNNILVKTIKQNL